MNDLVRHLVSRLDRERQPIVTAVEMRRWPINTATFVINAGLLQEVEPAESLVHDGCGERCVITPDLIENPETRQVIAVHYCKHDDCGRITFDPIEMCQWQPSIESLALILTNELDLGTSALSIVPDRMYLLGVIPTGAGPLDVFLGRGLSWDDAPTVIERSDRLKRSTGSVLIVMKDFPPTGLLQGLRTEVISLTDYVSWNDADSCISFGLLAMTVRSLRPPVLQERWLTVSECADLLLKDVSGIDRKQARARVSWAATVGKFRTNGKKRNDRRIDRDSFSSWRLEQRERDLDADDEGPE